MNKKRTKYSDEFKEEAVKLVMEQGYKVSDAARNLGCLSESPLSLEKGI